MAGAKDVYYRFMDNTAANWIQFIRVLSVKLIDRIRPTFESLSGVLVLDDTIFKRDRSKHVELLSRVRDHNDGRYYKGFEVKRLQTASIRRKQILPDGLRHA